MTKTDVVLGIAIFVILVALTFLNRWWNDEEDDGEYPL